MPASKLGLPIVEETSTMRVSQSNCFGIKLQDKHVVEADQFSYLANVFNKDGLTDQDIDDVKIRNASDAFKTP